MPNKDVTPRTTGFRGKHNTSIKLSLSVVLIVSFFVIGGAPQARKVAAQAGPTATPARITIPTLTPIITDADQPTATWTPTPTPIGVVLLEALNEANVRAEPDVNSERLGSIKAGDTYPVIGRSFRWLEFKYDVAVSGTGWVYDELVNIIGNPDDIVDLNANLLPTVDTASINATQTWEAIVQTPGGILTTTADARIIQPPVTSQANDNPGTITIPGASAPAVGVLPTYTFPPDVPAQAPTLGESNGLTPTPIINPNRTSTGGVAPIVPILLLGGAGMLGLVFSSTRRR